MKPRPLSSWIMLTIFVLLAAAAMVRLGIWQLDRLQQRRDFNQRVVTAQSLPELNLTQLDSFAGLVEMEYRPALIRGEYLFSEQVAIRNQVHQGLPGIHLLTPLKIEGQPTYVLVDRGWIPLEDADPSHWSKYDQLGLITVKGVLRQGQARPEIGYRQDPELTPGQNRLDTWNFVNLERISAQSKIILMPVYLQQSPHGVSDTLPAPESPVLDLSEGPHQSYAIQWFTFASILMIGYPIFVYRSVHQTQVTSSTHLIGLAGVQEKTKAS